MIPSQEEADLDDPEEHFLPSLRNMPLVAGSGVITSPVILRGISKHLWEVGCFHLDYLRRMADTNGMLDVNKLPKPQKRFQKAVRGPYHAYNNAARWVSPGAPDPEPMTIQDVRKLTIQEQHVVADMLRQTGVIRDQPPQRNTAEELNEG